MPNLTTTSVWHGVDIAAGAVTTGAIRLSGLWLPLVVLLLGLMFITYWQATDQMNDISEIDAHLLAEELPFDAFIDTGFDTWLEGSSEE